VGVGNQQISPLSNELLFRMTPPDGRDNLVFMQSGEPGSLFCADESDGEALRACEQTMEPLYSFEENGTDAIPALATDCSSNEDLTVWTCTLGPDVTFRMRDLRGQRRLGRVPRSGTHYLRSVGATGTFSYWPGLWEAS
jgi:ABC-type transport system substrate-binding protein